VKPEQRAIVSSVELCSLVYQAGDLSGGNLVGSAIFGDGAAAVLLEGSGEGLRILAAQSHLVPESAFLMGYGIEDDGVHLRLDRALPQALSQHAPPFVRSFLAGQDTRPEEVSWWLFHPGGVKVLAVLEDTLAIRRDQSRWAWDVLEQYGNMSSASILFVLDLFLKGRVAKPGQKVCMLGVGPGLTIEAILCQQD
jgi:alkylresorcinol/alkylpyrone synthase